MKNVSPFLKKFAIFVLVTDSYFLWHIFSSRVKWLFYNEFCQALE
ncbi:hypothetical protein wVul_0985 [Wolbachia endosymbiont of Armadillidium vulgare str. wVulC]|nr:hypothetical protein wVul_0985 [Wolbachia endosymbiont of Armadillidium vulgare str. wVulC]